MPENPVGTQKQREELRHHLLNVVKPNIWGSRDEAQLIALDGLDIAEEMAHALDWLAAGFPDIEDTAKASEAVRRWQAWKQGR